MPLDSCCSNQYPSCYLVEIKPFCFFKKHCFTVTLPHLFLFLLSDQLTWKSFLLVTGLVLLLGLFYKRLLPVCRQVSAISTASHPVTKSSPLTGNCIRGAMWRLHLSPRVQGISLWAPVSLYPGKRSNHTQFHYIKEMSFDLYCKTIGKYLAPSKQVERWGGGKRNAARAQLTPNH